MNVKELLTPFTGANHIKIFNVSDWSTNRYNSTQCAIKDFSYYPVKSWEIADNALIIRIQSQF